MDQASRIHGAYRDGKKEGIKEGIEEGKKEGWEKRDEHARNEKLESARKMKTRGYPTEEIADITGLAAEEIERL